MGKQLISLPSCHSTNDLMAQMSANKQLYEGAVIITADQTDGKGQRGNKWQSNAGENLTFSIWLKPKFLKPTQQFELNRVVALALLDVLKDCLPTAKVFVKWPNDLMLNKKKVAGVLIENSISKNQITESIVGIGLNVNQNNDLLSTATSMIKHAGTPFDLPQLLEKIVHRMEHYYLILRGGDLRLLHFLYEKNLFLKDQVAHYEDATGKFNGIIRNVSAEGMIKIAHESGVNKAYRFKEVRLLS